MLKECAEIKEWKLYSLMSADWIYKKLNHKKKKKNALKTESDYLILMTSGVVENN